MRKYEPFLFFHREDIYKELFYPMDANDYVKKCSLWFDLASGKDRKEKDEGNLDLKALADFTKGKNDSDRLYLKFVEKYNPLSLFPVQPKDYFWDYTLAAQSKYINTSPEYTYYYRQFTEPDYGYLVLQYWFFYAFNSWGAYHFGFNIHEGDWESITLFLNPVTQVPIYVAYSAHHDKENKVRRRWEEIRKTGAHPNVFVALGSHANYFDPKHDLAIEEYIGGDIRYRDKANGLGMIVGPLKPEGAYDWNEWEKRIILEDEIHSLPDWAKFYKGKWGMDAVIDEFGFAGPRFPPFQSDNDKWYRPAKWAKVPSLLIANLTSVDTLNFPEIKLYTTVEAGSEPVLDLNLSNFRVYEDQTRESLVNVSSVGAGFVGTSVCIVMDTSGSMQYTIRSAKQASINFVNNLKPEDKAALIRFNETVYIVQPFTGDKNTLIGAINNLYADGMTAFYDALYKGVAMVSTQPGIKAIVALTDGKDNRSTKTAKEVIDYARSVSVPIYIVGFVGDEGIDERTLWLISEETEGQYYQTTESAKLLELYESISERLKNLYEVSYTTHNPVRDGAIRSVIAQVTYNETVAQDSIEYIAPALTGAISGVVLDSETEEPISSARVVIEHETKKLKVTDASVTTDKEGKYWVENLSPDFAYTVTASVLNYHRAVHPSLVKVKPSEVTDGIDFKLHRTEDYFITKRELIQDLRDKEKVYIEEENKAEQFLAILKKKGTSATDQEKEALQRLYLSENFANEAYKDSRRLAHLATNGLGGFVDVSMAVISNCGMVGESLKKIPFVGNYLASPYIAAKNEMVNLISVKSYAFLNQTCGVTWTLKSGILFREAVRMGYDKIFIKASEELAKRRFSDAMAEVHEYIEKGFFLRIYEDETADFIDKSVEWAEEITPVFRVGRYSSAESRVNTLLSAMNTENDAKIENAEMLIWAGDTIQTAGGIASGVALAGGVALSAISAKTIVGAPLAAILIPLSTKIYVATKTAGAGMKIGTAAGITVYLWSTIPRYVKEGTAYSFDMSPSAFATPPLVVMQGEEAPYKVETIAKMSSGLRAPSMATTSLMPHTVQYTADNYNSLLTEIRGYIQNDEPKKVQEILEELIESGAMLLGDINVSTAQILTASQRALHEVPDYDAMYSKFETVLSKATSERISLYTLLTLYLAYPANASIKELITIQIDETTGTNNELAETLTSTTQALNEARITIPTLVIIKSFSTPDVTPQGESFTVSAMVKNIGQRKASKVRVGLSVPRDSGLTVLEKNDKSLGDLDAGEEREIGWKLECSRRHLSRESGVNLVTISVSSALSDAPDFDSLPPTYIFIPEPPPTPPTGGKLSNKNIYAYPNPFNPDMESVNVRYSLSKSANVTIEIYDASGELVTTLIKEETKERIVEYSESWNGRNAQGDIVANGVYFYLITTTGDEKAAGKIAVLR